MFRDAIKLAMQKINQKRNVQTIHKRQQTKEQDFVVLAIAVTQLLKKVGLGNY